MLVLPVNKRGTHVVNSDWSKINIVELIMVNNYEWINNLSTFF